MAFTENSARTLAVIACAMRCNCPASSSAAAIASVSAAILSAGRRCASFRAKDFGNAANPCRDDRNSSGRGLQHDIGERFGARGDDKDSPHRKGLACGLVADKAYLIGNVETLGQLFQGRSVWAVSGNGRAHPAAGSLERRQRFDENIECLHASQFADADEVGCIEAGCDGNEFGVIDPVAHDAPRRARRPDFFADTPGRYSCFRTGRGRCAN